ncbi:tape measure protein [Leuconostoc mesenteroides]|uniref:tape measure protein n=1 Tax=Leuconostoc mesenteroides TaxID=1245 RepID=UPI0021A305EB|nr:tape measure protein [Leuconostoc mesenteroides]MCT3047941.1 CHAP domain-containing protein [Leuconostoc mesenteroides]
MAKQIVNEMATNLTLDSNSASQALKELTREVKNSSTEAKILESQYKASGDAVSASKAKYEGLQSTLEAQKTKIEALKSGLDNVNTSTKKGQDLQQYLNGELAKAERQYASYQGQLEKATQSYKYQESGLASLNDELKHSNSLTDARVQKLEAEGRTEEANKVKLEGLKNTQENYTKQLEIQKAELNKLAETGDKNTDSYKRQELRVEQMGAKLASTTSDIKHFNNTDIKPETKGLTSVKDKLNSLNDSLEGTRSHFKTIFMGNLIANGVTNALESIKDKFTDLIREGAEYNKEQQVMSATWDTLTGDAKKGQAMVDSVNSISTAFGQSADLTNELEQQFYHVFNQQGPTDTLTKSVLTMADTIGMSADETKRLGLNFTHMMTSSKLQLGDFNMITDQLPMYGEKLLEFERNQQNNQKLTMSQLRDQMSAGKISAEDAEKVMNELGDKYKTASENMMSTTSGMERVISARGTALAGALTKPIMEAKNPLFGAVSKWVSDKNTENEFTKVGESVSKSFSTITEAFGKQFKSSTFTDGADNFMKSLSTNIEKFGDYISKHAGDITNFFKMTKELGGAGFSTMGTTLKIALPLLEDLGKFASKHPTTFKVLAGSILGLNLALKATLSTMAVFGKTKAVFGALSGLIIKPKVDGGGAKRELGILGKAGKGIGKAFWWTGKLAVKSVLKSLELIGDATIKTGKALWWTAKLATKVFLKSLELLGGAVIKSGKLIGKGLVFTAKIATKGASLALAGLVKTAKVTGTGIKLAFNFLKANPLILLVTAITAVVIAFAELYKHNKKFRNFVNGLVKSAQQFFKGIGKWFGQAYKTIMNFFKDILNFVKKDWKEILLFIVNPFAGAFALVYKHNAKFRKSVNNLVKDVVNFFKNMGKSIGDIFNSIFKNVSKIYNGIKDFIGDTTHNIYKGWVNSWKSIFNFFGDTWNNIKKFGSNSINSLKGTFDDVLGKIGRSFSNTWNGIKDGFKAMWDGMKQLAGDGINAVIKIPNAGIDGINGLIHDFGGSKNAIGKIPMVKFANGTGAIQELTHAVLNDGNDSPETGNKETLIHPNGKMELVQGRNTERLLLPGTEVLNARETAMFMGLQGIKHFAGGTGFWSKLLSGAGNAVSNIAGSAWSGLKNGVDKFTKMFSYITGAVADPSGTLGKVLNLKSGGVSSVMDGVSGGAYKKVTSTAKDWWSTLWSMASESSSSGTGSKGDDYAFKNKSKDSGVDPWGYFYRECVSFIASRLKNLGVSASLFSHLGNGADWVNAKVPHSKTPKVGDVAVYAAGSEFGNHASIVTGVQGDKISGEEYNWSGDGKYHTYNGRRASGATTFLDFGRSAGAKAKEVATNNPLSKLIKKQTGGMMEWIQKFIAPINDSSTGADNDVQSWSSDVKKALSKLGLSTSGSMVSKVLKQIQTESGGNAKAVQHGYRDVNTGGNEARGLMQVTPRTFKAYALDGYKNIMNAYDNILAGLNYAKHRYGDSLSFLGHGHGYANGGLITKHQIAEIGEGNQPEMIIPLSGMKRSRGFELLGKTAVAMAQRDGATGTSTNSDSDVINQLKQAVELLTQLVKGQGNPVPVNVAIDKNDLYKKQASDVNLRGYQSLA